MCACAHCGLMVHYSRESTWGVGKSPNSLLLPWTCTWSCKISKLYAQQWLAGTSVLRMAISYRHIQYTHDVVGMRLLSGEQQGAGWYFLTPWCQVPWIDTITSILPLTSAIFHESNTIYSAWYGQSSSAVAFSPRYSGYMRISYYGQEVNVTRFPVPLVHGGIMEVYIHCLLTIEGIR